MKRFLLIGIGGVYNYGCEAIVRGTETILHQVYPDAEVVYASRRPLDDAQRLAGSNITIIERRWPNRYSPGNICRKALSFMGVKWNRRIDSLKLLRGIDAVLSIGGDIFTLGPGGTFSTSFAKFGDDARKMGVPYALWGASVGPFSDNPRAERVFKKHLKGLSLIAAREPGTVKYLHSLGIIDNVVPCADPAYMVATDVKTDMTMNRDRPRIGINLSPLSLCYVSSSREHSIRLQAQAIQSLIQDFNANIVLIPHVVCDFFKEDDDRIYLRKVKQAIEEKYQNAVTLLESDLGFIATKKEIVKCDLIIAARMHCAINALAATVPTILLSYSQKAVGMCQYIYGSNEWVMSLNDLTLTDVLTKKVKAMLDRKLEIHTSLMGRIPEAHKDAVHPGLVLKKILESRRA